jgi:2-iminobutanoate/2-iminopropanoate deaminase
MKKVLYLIFFIIVAGSCKEKVPSPVQKEVISLDGNRAGRPYSPAIRVDNTLYISGQIAIDPATGEFVEGGIEEQTRQVLVNISALLDKAGYSLSDVVKCNVLMADIEYYSPMNSVYSEFFTVDPPARKAFAVKDLPMGALVEIDAIAIK